MRNVVSRTRRTPFFNFIDSIIPDRSSCQLNYSTCSRRSYFSFSRSRTETRGGYYWKLLTSKVFPELLLHLQCSFVRFLRLFLGHSLVHFPLNTKQSLVKKLATWSFENEKKKKNIERHLATYITDSTDFGLMKMAMGYSCATCNLLMAFPLTSRIQCFPCHSFLLIHVIIIIIIYYRLLHTSICTYISFS